MLKPVSLIAHVIVACCLTACSTASTKTSPGTVEKTVQTNGDHQQWSSAESAGDSGDLSTAGEYKLGLDLGWQGGCSRVLISVGARGAAKLEMSASGESRLTMDLKYIESSTGTDQPPGQMIETSVRRWKRVYEWKGRTQFLGAHMKLHLEPVGKGCKQKHLYGHELPGCVNVVPALVMNCRQASLDDSPVEFRGPRPKTDVPTGGYLICQADQVGQNKKTLATPEFQYLKHGFPMTRDGRPDLVLSHQFFGDFDDGVRFISTRGYLLRSSD